MRYFKRSNGDYARIGRFTWGVESPLFGKYYIDLHNRIGMSCNTEDVPCGVSLSEYEQWLNEHEFEELAQPIIAASGWPIMDDTSLIEFSR